MRIFLLLIISLTFISCAKKDKKKSKPTVRNVAPVEKQLEAPSVKDFDSVTISEFANGETGKYRIQHIEHYRKIQKEDNHSIFLSKFKVGYKFKMINYPKLITVSKSDLKIQNSGMNINSLRTMIYEPFEINRSGGTFFSRFYVTVNTDQKKSVIAVLPSIFRDGNIFDPAGDYPKDLDPDREKYDKVDYFKKQDGSFLKRGIKRYELDGSQVEDAYYFHYMINPKTLTPINTSIYYSVLDEGLELSLSFYNYLDRFTIASYLATLEDSEESFRDFKTLHEAGRYYYGVGFDHPHPRPQALLKFIEEVLARPNHGFLTESLVKMMETLALKGTDDTTQAFRQATQDLGITRY